MSEKVLIRHERPYSLLRPEFADLEEKFVSYLKGRVEQAWLFGSYAEKSHHQDSDIDLILVKKTEIPFIQRFREFPELFDIYPNIDLLIYTPAEFEKLTSAPTLGFWQSVVKTMRRIL